MIIQFYMNITISEITLTSVYNHILQNNNFNYYSVNFERRDGSVKGVEEV